MQQPLLKSSHIYKLNHHTCLHHTHVQAHRGLSEEHESECSSIHSEDDSPRYFNPYRTHTTDTSHFYDASCSDLSGTSYCGSSLNEWTECELSQSYTDSLKDEPLTSVSELHSQAGSTDSESHYSIGEIILVSTTEDGYSD